MNINARSSRTWQAGLTVAALAVLVACGGGGGDLGSGGSGTAPPEGVSVGTVTGFGSVIVDGVEYTQATGVGEVEREFERPQTEEIKLGQHVEFEFEGGSFDDSDRTRPRNSGTISSAVISPELVGKVDSVNSTDGSFVVLGQTVTVNTTAANGPVTLYENVADSKALVAGDSVEVHAIIRRNGATVTLQATRIERKSVAVTLLRIAGVAENVAAAGTSTSFNLGPLRVTVANANLRPAGASVANGRAVAAFADVAGYTAGASPTLQASGVRVKSRGDRDGQIEDYVGGVISNFVAGTSFDVNGVHVTYTAATRIDNDVALADGAYVRVRGNFDAAGNLAATRIKRRDDNDETLELHFFGSVLGLNTSASTFQLQGTLIDYTGVVLDTTDCPAGTTTLVEGLQVEVEGVPAGNGRVRATEVKCDDDAGSGSGGGGGGGGDVQRLGRSSEMNLAARTFTLTTQVGSGETLTVTWSDSTFFRDGREATLVNGLDLEVEGHLNGTTLAATKIKLKD